MLDLICDECGKKYRVHETDIRGNRVNAKCKACSNAMVVTIPLAASKADPSWSVENAQPSVTADITDPPIPQPEFVPRSVVEGPAGPAQDKSAGPIKQVSAFLSGQKVRFRLFGKLIIVMLIVSLLPFAVFWGFAFRETKDRVRQSTEKLMVQTARTLSAEIDARINNNVSILRTAAKLPEIVSMDSMQQEMILKVIQKENPWMYLVFITGPDGMNVARNDGGPLKDYSNRRYYKDILAGKKLSWQTLIGETSNKPSLVLAVPIKIGDTLLGVMAAAIPVDYISNNIATWRKEQTGFAFVVDENGFVISHPDKQFLAQRKNLNSHPLIAGIRKKGWQTTTSKFIAPTGEIALGHVRGTSFGWALVLQQQNNEIIESFNRVQEFGLIFLAGTVLLVLIIAGILARRIVGPILKLADAAERMSRGELNVRLDIKTKDEIGLLAQALGRLQNRLGLAMSQLRRKR